MKIVYIITRSDEIGGAQIHVSEIALRMKQEGHEVFVLGGHKGVFADNLMNEGIDFISLKYLQRAIGITKDVRAFFEIRQYLKKNKPDIVTCHSSKAGVIGRLAAYSLNIPVIFTVHGWAFWEDVMPKWKIHFYVFIERIAARFCSKIITVSKFDMDAGIRHKIAKPSKFECIYNGVYGGSNYAFNTNKTNDLLKVVMVARLGEQKDQESLIKSCQKLDKVEITFIGEGTKLNSLMKLAIELNMKGRVKFMGFQKNVVELLPQFDLFALISNAEGFPRTTIEAMSCGLPTIVSDVGGAAEAVLHGITGLVVKHNDIEQITRSIAFFLTNPLELQIMGKEALQRFESTFTFEKMFRNTLQIYKDEIAK